MMSSFIIIVIITSVAVCSLVRGENSITFSIVEELPSGARIGSIANESEKFLNYTDESKLLYNFLPPTEAQTLLSINDETGDLYTSVVIDREGVCEYDTVCKIEFDVAVRSTDNQFFKVVPVVVIIEDKNDNSPMFPVDVYHLNISEGSHTGSFQIQQAIDKDTGGNNSIQNYQLILNEQSEGYFDLNYTRSLDKTFVLKLILKKILDRETQDIYTVEVIAKDGGNPPNTGTLKIVIRVTDTNDNAPQFTQEIYNVSVKENIKPMETILQLSATDNDLGNNAVISYRISEFQKDKDILDEIFLIEENTGKLKVKTDLSTVAGQQYRFIVKAIDHGVEPQFSQAEVIVHIEDYTNNAPSVSVSFIPPGNKGFVNISENSRNLSFVAHVNVDDQDNGLNGEVDCEISSKHFNIVPLDRGFKVVVNAVLDREVKNSYNLTVTCSDKGTPVMSGSTHFIVRITDYNDNKPVFDKTIYSATLAENNKGSEVLLKVSASDADEGNNGLVHYVPHSDVEGRFILDRVTGVVSVNAVFDRELEPSVTFHVLAIDNGSPELTGTATVVLTLEDTNDNVPKFNKTVHAFEVDENLPTGTDVAILEAFDLDEGVNAEYDFTIDPEYIEVPFVLFSDGLLKANKQLDREERSRYDFVAKVTDHGNPQLSSMAHVTIIVKDTNDNSPIVTYPSLSNNSVSIPYPDYDTEFVARVEAYDLDEGRNKELQYAIKHGNDLEIFDIEKDTGVIFVRQQIDIGGDHIIQLSIAVSDKGAFPLATMKTLNIELKYTNATFLASVQAKNSKHIIISVVVVIVTLVISGAIIGVILVLRTLDRKQKMKASNNNSSNTESDFGFTNTQNHTVLSTDTLSSGSAGESNDLIKKKEVSFVLDNNDSFDYHQKRPQRSSTMISNEKPSKSSLRYSPQVVKETPSNVLDTRELQNEANAQLQSMKIQQMILQTRAKQWVQQQQQEYGIIHHDGDHHSDGSAETIGSDSGRGCSEEDDVFSTPSADDPKLFELSSPESQHSFLPRHPQDSYTKSHNSGSYRKQPWTRRPHLAHKDFKTTQSQLSLNRNLNIVHSNPLDSVSSSYGDSIQNRMSWGSAYYGSVAPMDYTGDSALHSFFDKTPVMLMPRDDDDNCSTTTSGSYTLHSEDIL